jgi:Tfp pilus assembly protein FimT
MVVVAIVAIVVGFAASSWQRTQQNNKTKFMARQIAGAFELAHTYAIQNETVYGVYVSLAGRAQDMCGNALPANQPITVFIDNVTQNCCIDAGETQLNYPSDTAAPTSLAWGATWAAAVVPTDQGSQPGNLAQGTSLPFTTAGTAPLVLFRADGVPVLPDNVCNMGTVGSGTGGFYLTTGTNAAADARDYAVVISPLGATRIHSFNRSNNTWTN